MCHPAISIHIRIFLNKFLKAVRVGVQNRSLQTASYLAETPAGNREGNKLTLPHQQPPPPHPGCADVPVHAAAGGEQEGSIALGCICSLLLQGELSLWQRHGQARVMLRIP